MADLKSPKELVMTTENKNAGGKAFNFEDDQSAADEPGERNTFAGRGASDSLVGALG